MDSFEVSPLNRSKLEPLFAERRTARAVIDAILEGNLGRALADDSHSPRVARLDLGCYSIFAGDVSSPLVEGWLREIPAPKELLFPDSEAWRSKIRSVHGPRLTDRSMQAFSARDLNRQKLIQLAAQLPSEFQTVPLDAPRAALLDTDLEPHALQVFESAEDFGRRGIGFCALQGEAIASVASSYTISRRHLEIAISCHPAFRRRGLAKAVAARLLLHCLDHDLEPHWNAANPISIHLAKSLGFQPSGICEVLFLNRDSQREDGQ